MGYAADDAWESAFEQDLDERLARQALRDKCPAKTRCPLSFFYNDDGLFECPRCGNMVDV